MSLAVISLIILAVCIILFITRPIPNAATACLGCLMFALTGVCTLTEAFSGFSNSTVLLMFGMMVVGIAMMDSGIANLIGKYVSKISGGNERLFIFIAGTASALLSSFLSNTAVIAIFLPIIASVSHANSNMSRKNLTLPVSMGAMFGGVCTLIGSTPQLTANGILSKMSGVEMQMFDFTKPGIIIFLVYMIYVLTIGYVIGNKVWGSEQEVVATEAEIEEAEKLANSTLDKRKLITMLIIFILTVVLFIGAWIPVATTAIISALLCIITKCTNQKSIIKNMDWSVVFILAGCLGIATGLTNSGAGDLLADVLSNIIKSGISPIIIFAFFVILTMIISNFITNSTAVVITLPIALSFCSVSGLNPIAFALGIVFASNLTFSTPLANAQTAMTLVAGYKFSDYIKYTGLLALVVCMTIIVVVPIFFPLA